MPPQATPFGLTRLDEGARGRGRRARTIAGLPTGPMGRTITYSFDFARLSPGRTERKNSGKPVPDFGRTASSISGMGSTARLNSTRSVRRSPAMIVGDVAIIGAALLGGTAPTSKTNVPGYIRGYDVRTGKLLWTFHTIPQGGEFGNDTWEGDSWKYTGNTGGLGADERRSRTGLRLSSSRNTDRRLLRRPSARRQPVRRQHRLSRRQNRTSASGTISSSIMTSGIGIRLRRRCCWM